MAHHQPSARRYALTEEHAARDEAEARPAAPTAAPGETVVLDVAVLAAAHPALRTRALRGAALRAGATPGALTAAHVEALDAVVADYHGQGPVQLPGGVVAHRRCGRLSLDPR